MGDSFHGRTIRQQVHHRLGELTPAERRVARVLLTAYPIAGLETVAELADRAGSAGRRSRASSPVWGSTDTGRSSEHCTARSRSR